MAKIPITELDFDNIKANLKAFLESQSEFSDMDFEGSGMSILLDILAYNTHYSAMYASFLGNEMFLDSAAVRSSIVSVAKHLNYTPQSRVSPKALLDITLLPIGSPPAVIIAKGTEFSGTKDSVTYIFSTIRDLTVPNSGGNYIALDVPIYEGKFLEFTWTKDDNLTDQRFVIPNEQIDVNTITLTVKNSEVSTVVNSFVRATQVTTIDNDDRVYWLQEVEDQKYEILFGNDVVGKGLDDGNIIKVEYLSTTADAGNFISEFSAAGSIGGLTAPNVSFTTSNAAAGGAERETDESIKFLAPKNYSTQGRAVTITDYQNILLSVRTDIESITGYGGEDAVPPQYGRVFISIKPKGLDKFSNSEKENIIKNVLKPNNVVSIAPILLDPDITYFNITSDVNYNAITLTTSISELQENVEDAIKDYFQITLNKFSETFRFSVMTGNIDESNQAILNNQTSVILEKRHKPVLLDSFTVPLAFNNAIDKSSITTNLFTLGTDVGLTLDDDGEGVIRVVQIIGENTTIINFNAGTVDYVTGRITLAMTIDSYDTAGDDRLKVFMTPTNQDVIPIREQILTLDELDGPALAVTLFSEIP